MWPLIFAFIACEEEKVIIENLELTPTESLNFEEVAVGEWRQENIGLINTGNSTVDILSVTMVDVSANVWDLNWTEQSDLEPGEMAEFSIRFEPIDSQSYSARIQIRNSTELLPIIYIDVNGTGGVSIVDSDGDGFSPAEGDCNDDNDQIYPDAEEI